VTLTAERTTIEAGGSVERRDSDGAGMSIALVVLLLGIPSALIFEPLGAAGTPADIVAILLLGWWVAARIMHAAPQASHSRPVHITLFIFVVVMLASYAHGMMRPISGSETSAADRGILALLAWAGMVLGVADGLRTRAALDRFLRVLVVGGACIAALGILQFFAGVDLASYIHIPGLVANHPFGLSGERSNFRRVTATTLHPIEFGVVLSLILPVALHFALQSPTRRQRRQALLCSSLMIIALPMTVARSAMVGLGMGLAVVLPTWSSRHRRYALIAAPFFAVGIKVAKPGLLGTIRSLFLHAGQDPSIQNRVGDYTAAGHYITQSPIIGRGFFTFLPEIYRTLDNQYMGTLIESGILGLAALLSLMVVGISVAATVRKRVHDTATRSLAQALLASMAVALVTFFTFDAFAFPMATGVMFILLGAVGALGGLYLTNSSTVPSRIAAADVAPTKRLTAIAIRATAWGLVLLALVSTLTSVRRTAPQFESLGRMVLAGPAGPNANVFDNSRYLGDFAAVLQRSVAGPDTQLKFKQAGLDDNYNIAIGTGSLAPGTDIVGTGAVISVNDISSSPALASATCNAVLALLTADLVNWQNAVAVPVDQRIHIQLSFPPPAPVELADSRKRAEVVSVVVALCVGLALQRLIGFWLRRNPRGRALLEPQYQSVTFAAEPAGG
jgi:hypothetical protein